MHPTPLIPILLCMSTLLGCADAQTAGRSDRMPADVEPEPALRYVSRDRRAAKYSAIVVDQVRITFEPGSDISQEEAERLSKSFANQLTKDLLEADFWVTTAPGTHVVRLRLTVKNCKTEPSPVGGSAAGELRLGLDAAEAQVEVLESGTDKRLAAAFKPVSEVPVASPGSGDAETIFEGWSKAVVSRLSAARGTSTSSGQR